MKDDLRTRYGEERLPRYTSYPTAPQFSNAIGHEAYGDWLASLAVGTSASLYLHVPFCRSMCWYCGCHTTITQRDAPIVDYLEVLRREIGLVAERLTGPLPVRHVHFGGGTPTIMEPDRAARPHGPDAAEVFPRRGDRDRGRDRSPHAHPQHDSRPRGGGRYPRQPRRAKLRSSGSEGDQPHPELRADGEGHAWPAGCGGARHQLRPDLWPAAPDGGVLHRDGATRASNSAPSASPSSATRTFPTFKKHQRKIDEAALPDGAARYEQAEAIAEALVEAGYRRIGLDHYALPDDSMVQAQVDGVLHRNFQGYTTDPSDVLIGFGASAIGRLTHGYAQNEVVLGRYAERISRGELATAKGYALTADDRLRADLIERVMCDFKVDVAEVCGRHGVAPETILRSIPRLRMLEGDGIVRLDGSMLSMNDESRFLVRSVASAFDAYLGQSGRTHSRAV